MEAEWRKLLAEVIGEYAVDTATVDKLLTRLKNTSEYGWAHSMWCQGATELTIRNILRQRIEAMDVTRYAKPKQAGD